MTKTVAQVLIALIGAVVAIVGSYFGAQREVQAASEQQASAISQLQQTTTAKVNQVAASTAGPLSGGQKLCRVLKGGTWRDGLIVPQDWTITLCQDYQKKSKGTGYQLGCVYPDQVNLGGEDGSIPTPNCNWR